jgi:hypothetical protein
MGPPPQKNSGKCQIYRASTPFCRDCHAHKSAKDENTIPFVAATVGSRPWVEHKYGENGMLLPDGRGVVRQVIQRTLSTLTLPS